MGTYEKKSIVKPMGLGDKSLKRVLRGSAQLLLSSQGKPHRMLSPPSLARDKKDWPFYYQGSRGSEIQPALDEDRGAWPLCDRLHLCHLTLVGWFYYQFPSSGSAG